MKITDLLNETPIDMTGDPNDPVVYGHEKANPMSLKGRIMSARAQLKELAEMAESNDLAVWEKITQLHKGGMFMGLAQNLEQVRHGIEELAAKRKRGGVASRGIDKNIGEQDVVEAIPFAGAKVGHKSADQVRGTDRAKNISTVLGSKSKKHPFDGKLVGGGM